MKKILLTLSLGLLSVTAFGQVIFSVENPTDIQGSYSMTYAETSGGWGTPDLLLPANAVTGEIVLGRSTTAASDTLMCTGAASTTAYTGKFVMVYRGDCEFGLKAKNAYLGGAKAVIIVNNAPGEPIAMSPGSGTPAAGAAALCPVIMVTQATGALIRAKIDNNIAVEGFIGNKQGYYQNDLGTDADKANTAGPAATPSELAKNTTEYVMKPIIWVHNYGVNDQSNVAVNAEILFNGTSVYSEDLTIASLISGDSAEFQFVNYDNSNLAVGKYEFVYTITSDVADDYNFDNTVTMTANITDKMFSFARLDTDGKPSNDGGSRPADFTGEFKVCTAFQNANASRLGMKGVNFSASVNATELIEGEEIVISVNKWNDVFTDLTDAAAAISNLEEVTFSTFVYTAEAQSGVNQYVMFDDPFMLENNQRYLVCLSSTSDNIFLGMDNKTSYETYQNYIYPQAISPISTTSWYLGGFIGNNSASIGIDFFFPAELGVLNPNALEVNAFPNPAKDVVNINLNNAVTNATLTISDVTGKIVATSLVSTNEAGNIKVNTNELTNGMYLFSVATTTGLAAKFNISIIK